MRNLKEQNTNQKNPQGKGVKYLIDDRVIVDSNKAIKVPVGNSSQRPENFEIGSVRYNTDNATFEGADGNVWRVIDGASDVDRDTFLKTETTPGNDNDQLEFFTENSKRAIIDSNGLEIISNLTVTSGNVTTLNGSTNLNDTLKVSGATTLNNDLTVNAITDLNGTLNTSGNATFQSNLTVNSTTDASGLNTASAVFNGGVSVKKNALFGNKIGVGVTNPSSEIHVNNDIRINSVSEQSGFVKTLTTDTETSIAEINSNEFRSGKFQIQAFNVNTSEIQISEVLLAHNGNDSLLTEYGVIFTGNESFVDYDTDISNGNVRILANSNTIDEIEYKIYSNILIS